MSAIRSAAESHKRPFVAINHDAKRSRIAADTPLFPKDLWTLNLRDYHRESLLAFRLTCRRFREIADELVNTCWQKLKETLPQGPIALRIFVVHFEGKYAGRITFVAFQAFRRLFASMGVRLPGDRVPLTLKDFTALQTMTEAVNDQALCILYKRLPPRLALPQAGTEAVKNWMNDPSHSEDLSNIDYLNLNHENTDTLNILPTVIGKMTSLQALYIQENNLKFLPRGFENLHSLATLSLFQNKFDSFPIEIASLTNLRELNLNNNAIVTLPKELASLSKLEELYLDGNPLMFIPYEVLASKNAGIRQCEAIVNFKEELSYVPRHSLASLYHAIIHRKNHEEIQWLFFQLSSKDKQLVAQKLKQFAAPAQTKNPHWGQDHLFDNMFFFCCAVRETIEYKFTQVPKHRVYTHACLLQGKDTLKCYHSDALDNTPSIADAVALIEREERDEKALKTLWKALKDQLPLLPALASADEIKTWLSDLKCTPLLDQVRSLNLSHKGLKTLPDEIRSLRSLKSLDLSHNALTFIPPIIGRLDNIETLHFEGNPLLFVDDEILYSMRDCFVRCPAVYSFKEERRYLAQSVLARLYQSKNAAFFHTLDPKDKALIYERWWHVDSLHHAVREAILAKFQRLDPMQKEKVYDNVCILDDGPITQWGRHHARDNLPRLADAIDMI